MAAGEPGRGHQPPGVHRRGQHHRPDDSAFGHRLFAEMERRLARQRTLVGLERVKATGKHLGRRKGSAGRGPERYRICAGATASHGAALPR